MNLDEAEKRIKKLETDVGQLKALIGRVNPSTKVYIEAIGKPLTKETIIPTVLD